MHWQPVLALMSDTMDDHCFGTTSASSSVWDTGQTKSLSSRVNFAWLRYWCTFNPFFCNFSISSPGLESVVNITAQPSEIPCLIESVTKISLSWPYPSTTAKLWKCLDRLSSTRGLIVIMVPQRSVGLFSIILSSCSQNSDHDSLGSGWAKNQVRLESRTQNHNLAIIFIFTRPHTRDFWRLVISNRSVQAGLVFSWNQIIFVAASRFILALWTLNIAPFHKFVQINIFVWD